jgi:hypothetical protein
MASPLSGIQRFQSGIGDGDDLRVFLKEEIAGGWYPVLKTGYLYYGDQEDYLFAQKTYRIVTVAASGAIAGYDVTGLTDDPTLYGPVFLRRQSDNLLLQRCASPLRAFQTLSFSTTGDVSEASVSGFVVSVVSDPTSGIYLRVPSLTDAISTEDYYYDPVTGKVQVKDPAPPSVYATWVVPETNAEQLRQWEIVKVDRDGKVRTQYTNVCMVSGLAPVVRKPTPSGPIDLTPTAADGNALTLPASGIVSGDLVSVAYYVNNSYSAVYDADTDTLSVRYLTTASGAHLLEWESALSDLYDTSQLPLSHVNRVQLNPLLERQEPCFLYLIAADAALPAPARVRISTIDPNLTWSANTPVPCALRVLVEDSEGNRVAAAQVDLTATLEGAALFSASDACDRHGKALFQCIPTGPGTLHVTAQVHGTSVSGTLDLEVHDRGDLEAADELELGKLLLHLEETPFRDNLYRLNAFYAEIDGAPFQPNDPTAATSPWQGLVSFQTGKSVLYTMDGRRLGPSGTVALDADAVASVLVEPTPGDWLRAEVLTPTTGRRKVARPVRVLDRASPDGDPVNDFGPD